MTLLNQIVAIETGVKSNAERDLTAAYHIIQKDTLFGGITRTYEPRDLEGDSLPPESVRVQQDVETVLLRVAAALTRLFDVTLTKEVANTDAKADLVVAGRRIADNVPVTYLITLEKKLVDLRTFISKLPLLDPADEWVHDGASGVYATPPTQTTRTRKVPRAFVKYQATDKHPAQVDVFHEDVIVGDWTTKKFAGRVSQERQTVLLERIDLLTNAVKMAREQANTAVVTDQFIGAALFAYLLEG